MAAREDLQSRPSPRARPKPSAASNATSMQGSPRAVISPRNSPKVVRESTAANGQTQPPDSGSNLATEALETNMSSLTVDDEARDKLKSEQRKKTMTVGPSKESLVQLLLEYAKQNTASKEETSRKIIDALTESHQSTSSGPAGDQESIKVSSSLGLHFGTVPPNGVKKSRTITITYPRNCLLESFIVIPPSRGFTAEKQDSSFDLNGSSTVRVEVTATPGTTFGAVTAWLVLLFRIKKTEDDVAKYAEIVSQSNCYAISRPLLMMISDAFVSEFKFDVYSKPFVPDFIANHLNNLPARLIFGEPPPSTNFNIYRVSYLHPFVWPEASALNMSQVAPLFDTDPEFQAVAGMALTPLNSHIYGVRLAPLLRAEWGYRMQVLSALAMYNVKLVRSTKAPNIFLFHVPGIVDDAPRLEVGDSVRLRKRAFDGFEYAAFITAVVRRSSSVFLSIPGSLVVGGHDEFNVQFCRDETYICHAVRALMQIDGILAADGTDCYLRRMLFPDVEDGLWSDGTLPGVSLTFDDKVLNWAQMKAVQAIVDQKYGDVPFLIWGPPGTGKTKTCIEAIHQVLLASPNSRILACAPSHSAADTITRRLMKRMAPGTLIRLNSSTRSIIQVPEELLIYCCIGTHGHFVFPDVAKILECRVLVATCADTGLIVDAGLSNRFSSKAYQTVQGTMREKFPFFFRSDPPPIGYLWTHLFIDEAGQASEVETAIPISVVATAPKHPDSSQQRNFVPIILSGDHMQLGPIVESPFARERRLDVSLFERIINRPLYSDHPESRLKTSSATLRTPEKAEDVTATGAKKSVVLEDAVAPFVNLIRNYRSHSSMLLVPSHISYNDTLIPFALESSVNSLLHTSILPNPEIPIVFIGVDGIDSRPAVTHSGGGVGSWWNAMEAAQVLKVVKDLIEERNVPISEFGIICPFREQVKRLRELLRSSKLAGVDVGIVEDYQGMERSVIVLSCVRSRVRFLEDDVKAGVGFVHFPQRLNVAMTRAKSLLVVVGNPNLLAADPHWQAYLAFYHRNNCATGCPLPPGILEAEEVREEKIKSYTSAGGLERARDSARQLASNIKVLGGLGGGHDGGDVQDDMEAGLGWSRGWMEDFLDDFSNEEEGNDDSREWEMEISTHFDG